MSTRQRQHFLATRGIPSEFLPVPAYPALGRLLRLDRDIDVLFLGRVKHGRRRREWPRLRGALVARGIRTLGITGDCYGEHRTELVNRTRLLLNLQNYPWNPAWIRFHIATLCGAAVVSEPIDDDEPYARGHDYLAAPRADLLVAIEELLQDESARRRLVDNASRICQARLAVPAAIEQLRSLAT